MRFSTANKKKHFWIALLALMCVVTNVRAQQNDFGVWTSVTLRHKFTQRIAVSLEEEFRFNQNATAIAQYFTDASIEYELSKKLEIALSYRFTNSFQQMYFSKRHRVYADLSYKTKYKQFQFQFRTRLQEQQQDIYSSETGSIPEWYSRNKLTVKFDLRRKYVPYVSAEMFYRIFTPDQSSNFIDKWRYTIGAEYEFNRIHTLDVFYLMQRERMVNNPITDFVFGIGYTYTF